MDRVFRRRLELVIRMNGYGVEHASLFPAGSKGAELFAALAAAVAELQELAGTQVSGFTSVQEMGTSKSLARKALKSEMEAISLTALSLDVTTPGVADKFRLPGRLTDQLLLATGRAFAKDAVPLKDRFILFEMPPNFLETLEIRIRDFETASNEKHSAKGARVAATASMEAAMDRAMEIADQLRGLVHNKVRHSQGLKSAWDAASRLERARKVSSSKETPPDKSTDEPLSPVTKG